MKFKINGPLIYNKFQSERHLRGQVTKFPGVPAEKLEEIAAAWLLRFEALCSGDYSRGVLQAGHGQSPWPQASRFSAFDLALDRHFVRTLCAVLLLLAVRRRDQTM